MEHIDENIEVFLSLIKGIAIHFGSQCETVLLDLTNYEKYGSGLIVAIENGHVTGRKVGDTGTNIGLEVLRGRGDNSDKHNYVTQTKDGRILRSTTMYIRNSKNIPIGCICINFDITELMMAKNTINSLTETEEETNVKEVFVNNVQDVLKILIQETQDIIGKPVAKMTKEDKKKGISYLDKKGAFLVTKSSDTICSHFNISKYTLYSYLNEVKKKYGDKNENVGFEKNNRKEL